MPLLPTDRDVAFAQELLTALALLCAGLLAVALLVLVLT